MATTTTATLTMIMTARAHLGRFKRRLALRCCAVSLRVGFLFCESWLCKNNFSSSNRISGDSSNAKEEKEGRLVLVVVALR
jgi:hypothetical protein